MTPFHCPNNMDNMHVVYTCKWFFNQNLFHIYESSSSYNAHYYYYNIILRPFHHLMAHDPLPSCVIQCPSVEPP
jgi:hypothetical protein